MVLYSLVDRWKSFSVTEVDYGDTNLMTFKIEMKEGTRPYRGRVRNIRPPRF